MDEIDSFRVGALCFDAEDRWRPLRGSNTTSRRTWIARANKDAEIDAGHELGIREA